MTDINPAGPASTEGEEPLPGPADEAGSARFIAAERGHRLAKLDRLRARGIDPYPVTFKPEETLGEVRAAAGEPGPDAETGRTVQVAGRIVGQRDHGGLIFLDVRDRTGSLQVLIGQECVSEEAFADAADLDLGDWIGITGVVMTTHTDELTVRAAQVTLLSKSLRALPSRLADVDVRYRERYLDLIVNESSRRTFEIRTAAMAAVRRVLLERGFTEVETPVLDTAVGGAAARPFITHHNALDLDMYLRIALELPLKRLIVGGMERVFEIGRVFRNEGVDPRHNPEFSLLEAYQAFGDYHDMMELVETIVSEACLAAIGTTVIQVDGRDVDLAPPWRRISMADLIEEQTGERMHPSMDIAGARAICDRLGIAWEESWGAGRLMSEVYDETGEDVLVEPTFVYDYPREISPLARTHRDDPTMTERFEAVVAGRELANAYSELNDPVDQRSRFVAEAAMKAAGDDEAQDVDEDYIRALEYGLPPTGGLGIGLDRMVMLIAGAAAIRDVMLFPTMRPIGDDDTHRASAVAGSSAGVPTAAMLAGVATPPAPAALVAMAEVPPPVFATPPAVLPAEHDQPMPVVPATYLPRQRVAKALAWLTGIGAVVWLIPLIPGVTAHLVLFNHDILERPERVAGHVAAVVAGLALLFVAPGLAHRKRRAWEFGLALFAFGAVVHIVKGPHPFLVLYAAAMIVALVWNRRVFTARSDPGSLLTLVWFIPAYLASVVTFGVVSLLLEQNRVDPALTPGGMFQTIFGGLVGLDGAYHYEGRFFRSFFPAALLALGLVGVAAAVLLALRAVTQESGPSERARQRARRIVQEHGAGTLDYFALRTDKSYFFGRDGESLIAYSFVRGYALVSGDPIGTPAGRKAIVAEFVAFCRDRAWHLAFLAVREDQMDTYSALGFHGVYLGDEAIIHCDTFTLQGGEMRAARHAVKRIARTHSFTLMREVDSTESQREKLNAIRERWRGKAPERGFTMELGRGVEGHQPDFLLAIASDASGEPVGFLRLVPCYGADPGYSLDLMQRNPDSVNGVTEYLIANAALALGERGFRRLSMNFATWGRLFADDANLSLLQRGQRRIATALNPFFQIKSLRDFNEKFSPEWVPRSIVVEDPAAMAKVGVLYASVEGFLNVPVIGRYLVPHVHGPGEEE